MAEYIEREALLEAIAEHQPMNWTDSDAEIQEQNDYKYYQSLIKDAPTADVVEVVRCKDCKHQKNDTEYCRTHNKYYCELDDAIKERNHYCSYGERRSKE